MKKIVFFVALMLVANLVWAVSEGGTGVPQPSDNGPQALPVFWQWLLSVWPF